MDGDLDSVFSNLNAEEEAPEAVAETPEQEAEPQQPEQAVVEEEVPVQPVAEEKAEEAKTVPLATFLDQRDELKELRRWRQEREALESQQKPQNVPDPYDDPQGYAAHYEQRFQQGLTAQKFEMSDIMARQVHGEDTVKGAVEWAMDKAKANPAFAAEYMAQAHPIDWIVRQHKRDGLLSQIGEDPDEYVRRRAAELGLTAPTPVPQAPAAQQQASRPAAPPKSLVNAPSQGGVGEVPVGKLAGMDAVFPG